MSHVFFFSFALNEGNPRLDRVAPVQRESHGFLLNTVSVEGQK